MQATRGALQGDRIALRGTVVVAHLAAERRPHQLALGGRQLLAAEPDLVQAQLERAGLLQLRQRRGAARIGDQHGGLQRRKLGSDLQQRPLHRQQVNLRPQARRRNAPQPLQADPAGKVPAAGADECKALAGAPCAQAGRQRLAPAQPQRIDRVVRRQAARVLHEPARHATGAGAGPEQVLAEPGVGDAGRVGNEGRRRGMRDAAVGGPIVEVLHQLGLADRGEVGQQRPARVRAVERRIGAGASQQGGQALLAQAQRQRRRKPCSPGLLPGLQPEPGVERWRGVLAHAAHSVRRGRVRAGAAAPLHGMRLR